MSGLKHGSVMMARLGATASLAVIGLGLGAPALANEGGPVAPPVQEERVKKWGPLGPVYDLAWRAARNGQYEQAIELLKALKRDDHPQVLNALGYCHRQSGKLEEALSYYEKALAIAPDFTPAREYLGEAWLALGEPVKAREQLAEIEKHCGTDCDDYRTLRDSIDAHVSNSSTAGQRTGDTW